MPRFYNFLLAGWTLALLPRLAVATASTRGNQLLSGARLVADPYSSTDRLTISGSMPPMYARNLLAGVQDTYQPREARMPINSEQLSRGNNRTWQLCQVRALLGGVGQGNFVAPATNPNPAVGSYPYSVAMGDVNGDGNLDLLTANYSGNTVSVRLNDGHGNFSAPVTNSDPSVGNAPQSVAVADVDGDLDLDLLTANAGANTVSVRLNDGHGNFSAPATNSDPAVGSLPVSVAVGDVNGDGHLDLLTANAGANTVSVRLNDGHGNFSAPATNSDPAVGSLPVSVAVGDVNGDGYLDLLTANAGANTVSVRLNDGHGNFSAPATNSDPSVGNAPYSVAMGDVDGDGHLDLLTANAGANTVSVRLNDGHGNFSAPATNSDPSVGNAPYSVAVGDVDGDGHLDLLAANFSDGTVSVRLNDGHGSFLAPTTNPEPAVGSYPQSVAVGDVDGDGDLDLLTTNLNSNTVSVRLNQPIVPLPVRSVATASALTLFPNPTHGKLTLLGAAPGTPVEILDALGRTVLRISTDATGTARFVLPTGLTSGIYLVRTSQQALRVVLD